MSRIGSIPQAHFTVLMAVRVKGGKMEGKKFDNSKQTKLTGELIEVSDAYYDHGTASMSEADSNRDMNPCYNCPFGNGEGGCTVPDCAFAYEREHGLHVPTSMEWVRRPDYVGD